MQKVAGLLDVPGAPADPKAPTTTAPEAPPPPPPVSRSAPARQKQATSPKPAPERKLQALPKSEEIPLDPETAQHIDAINLTPEGYQQFFQQIDESWFGYAQGHIKFNPERVPIPQGKTEYVTAHFTAMYTNQDGSSPIPLGEMAVQRLLDFEATREGPQCCGMNFIIDRNGRVIQTAPYNAKLRHNPPYDGKTTGFEIEATWQNTVSTTQFESATYLIIAMLANEHLLGTKDIGALFPGHGEMRDILRATHPELRKKWGIRDDFDAPVMRAWRAKVEAFLTANPNLAELTQPLR
jgi:hypothetical protein